MINVRGNFKNQFGPEGNFCQGCLDKNQIESQMHIYQCISLSSSELVESHASHRYDDLFSEDIEKQLTVSKILKKRMESRDQLIKGRQTTNNQEQTPS